MNINSKILSTVIDNGRVAQSENGFDKESLVVEVEFEANEQGLSEEETREAVEFAIAHTTLDA